ncbi:MAG: glycoside hydrolase family 30 protein [Clostridia bacterium]|nr:glycoside hydrolase family 30 protein [Clostridia bacterium]
MNIKAIKTVKGSNPMQEAFDFSFSIDTERERELICIFPDIEYQEIKGFGGAFTEAASTTIDKLSKENRDKIIKLYFDKNEGIGYNFGRVHINSCDFSMGNYTYVEENDNTLETFDVTRDEASIIPMIQDAKKYGDITLFASPWSPPAYMKTNAQMNKGGKLKEEYFELWSDYYVKFIEEYKKRGLDISVISVQNEPKAVQRWDSCIYTAEEERDFIKNYLGKKMADIGVKILFWDHNKERIIERAKVTIDKETDKYISGIAIHWYSGDHFEQLDMFKKLYPDKDIVFSEGCQEYSLGAADAVKTAERYAHDIIGNFNNGCNIFCDWNLVLNDEGGPNHVCNFCDAPIMADIQNDKFCIHNSYYYIGHFSKYVQKGAKRIGSSKWSSKLDTVSFKNPDGSVVTVVLNTTEEEISFVLYIENNMVETKIEPHSIATYIFEN